jgi:cyclophilin family peptidyl-prolyl cis-trans isomerase/HEAT repeat protein
MLRFVFLFAIALTAWSCDERKTSINKFSDPDIERIYELKDRRKADSLYIYLTNGDPELRREAALAFGSVQDSSAVANLAPLLDDKDRSVRKAAAFALGQTRCAESRKVLESRLAVEDDAEVFNEVAEAYGKVTKNWKNFSEQFYADSVRDHGVAWSLYRAGLNNAVDTGLYRDAVKLLYVNHREGTRLGVAHFFARGARDFTSVVSALIASAKADNSDEVQMAAALSLRRVPTDASFQTLRELVKNDNDFRVRVNAVRALQGFPFETTKEVLFAALRDKTFNVSVAASEVILAKAEESDWIAVANLAGTANHWRTQANLYQAALGLTQSKPLVEEVKTLYRVSQNPYQKAALLTALKGSSSSWSFINDELQKADTPIVKGSALSALVSINRGKNFNPTWKKRFLDIYKTAVESGDPALISTAADAIADSTLGYRGLLTDATFLIRAKEKLKLPKDADALAPLEAAIAYVEKRKTTFENKPTWNHPIDWNFVRTIAKDQRAIVKTSKGTITIRFFVEEAPGSVANFIALAQRDYFDHKFFHRVVPNFVIQGGCYRGDGTGSEDYSIRSEFSQRRYKTGSVGMASSGKDTEGTQWFITHSPTPHLDGRYSIFAEVEKGIEVVHQIEVGDEIIDVELPDFGPKEKND